MRNALAIARKELGIYFATPVGWIALAAVMGIASFFFVGLLGEFQQAHADARQYGWPALGPRIVYRNLTDGVVVQLWGVVTFVTLFVAPFLSMRLFSEEHKQRTFELLMTVPARPWEIVLGKFLGGVGATCATLSVVIVFPFVLTLFGTGQSGSAVEWPTVLLGFGGLLLWGATCAAVGMFISSLTQTQLLAGVLSVGILLLWSMLSALMRGAEEPVRSIARYVSADRQLDPLMTGVLELKSLVFFGSVIGLSLFLTHRRLELFRWA